ncbi:MAG: protein translocase subunit SecF [Candidatus Babeliales bacterium]
MINFLKYRYVYAFFSALMMVSFIGLVLYKRATRGHAFTYSIEFSGGTQGLFKFAQPVSSTNVISALEHDGWEGVTTREFGPQELLVRVKETSDDVANSGERMRTTLEKELGQSVQLLQIDSIGQAIGQTLSWNSLKAVLISLILMMIYIGVRFWSFSFGAGALISLFHDAIAILLFFLIFDKEISINVIGAILAVLGYSVNDTIVIFAQIRKNLALHKHMTPYDITNMSLNQTLRRTVLTAFATTLVVIALAVFGGEALRDLSLALLVGIVFGAYSSIYMASPIMLLLYKGQHN